MRVAAIPDPPERSRQHEDIKVNAYDIMNLRDVNGMMRALLQRLFTYLSNDVDYHYPCRQMEKPFLA